MDSAEGDQWDVFETDPDYRGESTSIDVISPVMPTAEEASIDQNGGSVLLSTDAASLNSTESGSLEEHETDEHAPAVKEDKPSPDVGLVGDESSPAERVEPKEIYSEQEKQQEAGVGAEEPAAPIGDHQGLLGPSATPLEETTNTGSQPQVGGDTMGDDGQREIVLDRSHDTETTGSALDGCDLSRPSIRTEEAVDGIIANPLAEAALTKLSRDGDISVPPKCGDEDEELTGENGTDWGYFRKPNRYGRNESLNDQLVVEPAPTTEQVNFTDVTGSRDPAESQKLDESSLLPPTPVEVAVIPQVAQEAAPVIAWASSAYGIWCRDGADPRERAPGEKVDGDWEGVVSDKSATSQDAIDGENTDALPREQIAEIRVEEEEEKCIKLKAKDVEGGDGEEHGAEQRSKEEEAKPASDEVTCAVDREEHRPEQHFPATEDGSTSPTAGLALEGGVCCPEDEPKTSPLRKDEKSFSSTHMVTDAHADAEVLADPVGASDAIFQPSFASVKELNEEGQLKTTSPVFYYVVPSQAEEKITGLEGIEELDWGKTVVSASLPADGKALATTGSDKLAGGLVEVPQDGGSPPGVIAKVADLDNFESLAMDSEAKGDATVEEKVAVAQEDLAGRGCDDSAEEIEWAAFEAPPAPTSTKMPVIESPQPVDEPMSVKYPLVSGLIMEEIDVRNLDAPQSPPARPNSDDWGAFKEPPLQPPQPPQQMTGDLLKQIDCNDDDKAQPTPGESDSNTWGAFEEVATQPPPRKDKYLPEPTNSIADGKVLQSLPTPPEVGNKDDNRGIFAEEPAITAPGTTGQVGVLLDSVAQTGGVADAGGETAQDAVEGAGAFVAEIGAGDDNAESEEEWSDFGDFEEAQTPEEVITPSPVPLPPKADGTARSSFCVAEAGELDIKGGLEGAGSWDAFAKGGDGCTSDIAGATPEAFHDKKQGNTAGEGEQIPQHLSASTQTLSVMVAIFDRIFGTEGSASTAQKAMSHGDSSENNSLDSLVDLAHLVSHAQPSPRAPLRLHKWGKSCILWGIRPVPEALEEDGSDEESEVSSGSGDIEVTVVSGPVSSTEFSGTIIPSPHRGTPVASLPRTISPPASLPQSGFPPEQSPPRKDFCSGSEKTASSVMPPFAPPPFPMKPKNTAIIIVDDPKDVGKDKEEKKEGEILSVETVVPVVDAVATTSFASFPSSFDQPTSSGGLEVVGSSESATPDMPRHPPPRIPSPPALAERTWFADKPDFGSSDVSASGMHVSVVTPTDVGTVVDELAGEVAGDLTGDVAGDAGMEVDIDNGDEDWDGDPFDEFQSAPPASTLAPPNLEIASVAEVSSSPPAEVTAWDLDFFMAAPGKAVGGAADGQPGVLPNAMFAAGVSEIVEVQAGKPLDLVSQALAGFGITSSPHLNSAEQDQDVWRGDGVRSLDFSEVKGATSGGIVGSGPTKTETERASSLEVSDFLRAARLRGGGKKGTRPAPPEVLSVAAQLRLAALPDLSFMLFDRLRFPMRAAVSIPGEGAT